MTGKTHIPSTEDDVFAQEVAGLPDATQPAVTPLPDGAVLPLSIGPVRNRIAGELVRMLAYNGSIPGPVLRARQGSSVTVEVTNEAELEQTVHWHGLRLDNRFDGVPYETQEPIPVGGRYTYELRFPDPGLYWYHPHIREDYGQEMGLYGQIIVEPTEPDYWPPVHREIPLTLDDVLLKDGRMPAFHRTGPTHTMMGRYGTVLLVGGQTEPCFDVTLGEVVRLHLTNTANTRIFNVAISGATLKLVGGDSGRYEREEFVDSVILAPSERAVVDVLFDRPGTVVLQHITPDGPSTLATFDVAHGSVTGSLADAYHALRSDDELAAERARLGAHRDRTPDKTLRFAGEMDMSGMDMGSAHGHDMGEMATTTWNPRPTRRPPTTASNGRTRCRR
jgi:FtsP/CotA-like multicopper oxidase with cupredoxin domain